MNRTAYPRCQKCEAPPRFFAEREREPGAWDESGEQIAEMILQECRRCGALRRLVVDYE